MTPTDLSLSGPASKKVPGTPHLQTSVSSAMRISELDGLRGLAILMVITCHYVGNAEHKQLGFWIHHFLSALTAGWSGVDLFFVLSGYLIGGILLDARNSSSYFHAFYMRRVHRILPVYYLWITIYAGLIALGLWVIPGRYAVSTWDFRQVLVQIFFLQNFQSGVPQFQWIWFVVTWSLAVEEQFYLLAPPLIRFVSVRKVVYILSATICLAPLLRFMLFRYWLPGTFASLSWMPCRADGLAWGMLLAIAWREEWFGRFIMDNQQLLKRVVFGLFLGVCGLVWWLAHPPNVVTVTIGYSWLGIFYCVLILLVLSNTGGCVAGVMRWKLLRKLGTISYCVYIIHDAFNQLAHRILLQATPQVYNPKGVAVTLLALLLTLSVASVSWSYFEKPLIRRGHRYQY